MYNTELLKLHMTEYYVGISVGMLLFARRWYMPKCQVATGQIPV